MKTKQETQERVRTFILDQGLRIVDEDFERPWGGFFVIHEEDTERFLRLFFSEEADELMSSGQKLSPKILVVEEGKRLSWQYHDFRAELHKVLEGPVAYCLSETDEQNEPKEYGVGELIPIAQGMRHRLIGIKNSDWAVVAETWKHTDPNRPSREDDIHRLDDDSGRK
jgi:quercetin dioxygenase-like cupin family protein